MLDVLNTEDDEEEVDHHADDHDISNCNTCERNWYDRTSGDGAH